jgi:DNA invertase Pin-like site-specific DNA recombinase
VIIGYARVSTASQNTAMQITALEKAGAEKIFIDEGVSGTLANRPQFDLMRSQLREGDVVVVYSLSRLGRGTKNALLLIEEFEQAGVTFKSVTENIDTHGAMGKALLTILFAVNQLEADLASERSKAGVAEARRNGRNPGRKPVLTLKQHRAIRARYESIEAPSMRDLAASFNVSLTTIQRSLESTNKTSTTPSSKSAAA